MQTINPARRGKIWAIGAVLVLLLVLAGAILLLRYYYHQQTQVPGGGNSSVSSASSFTVGPNALLILKEQGGNISVYPSHTDLITVRAIRNGQPLAPDVYSNQIVAQQGHDAHHNDQVTVSPASWFTNTDFSVTIPDTTAVQITLNSGSIDVHAGNGLSASTGSGSVALDSIQGPVNVRTDSGDITATSLNGTLTLAASSGSIRLNQVKGQLNAQTLSGDVVVMGAALSGQSLLQTQNGSVRFSGSLDSRGSYRMQTNSGDVDLTLPANAAFALVASTGSGNVTNDFGTNTVGPTPQAPLTLHTQNGSIVIIKSS